jgi:hypothetical protein
VVPVDPRWPRVDLRVVAGADGFAGGSAGSGCCRRRELDIMNWKGVCCWELFSHFLNMASRKWVSVFPSVIISAINQPNFGSLCAVGTCENTDSKLGSLGSQYQPEVPESFFSQHVIEGLPKSRGSKSVIWKRNEMLNLSYVKLYEMTLVKFVNLTYFWEKMGFENHLWKWNERFESAKLRRWRPSKTIYEREMKNLNLPSCGVDGLCYFGHRPWAT